MGITKVASRMTIYLEYLFEGYHPNNKDEAWKITIKSKNYIILQVILYQKIYGGLC